MLRRSLEPMRFEIRDVSPFQDPDRRVAHVTTDKFSRYQNSSLQRPQIQQSPMSPTLQLDRVPSHTSEQICNQNQTTRRRHSASSLACEVALLLRAGRASTKLTKLLPTCAIGLLDSVSGRHDQRSMARTVAHGGSPIALIRGRCQRPEQCAILADIPRPMGEPNAERERIVRTLNSQEHTTKLIMPFSSFPSFCNLHPSRILAQRLLLQFLLLLPPS
jgi:hypothetical protein